MLKIAIGDDYKSLNDPQSASQSYQEAFNTAWSNQQYAIAGDALKKLGKLYQEYEQWDSALQIYQELIKIEQQSYNLYGLMNTYDYMVIIYQQKEEENQALQYWQKALEIARHLNYKEDYFFNKISRVNEE
ncbi:MAG: tetratricopeptide repeat protein, partial [Cyanobacteria bacterium J149]